MLDYKFEYDGDTGRLSLTTHFGHKHEIKCHKEPNQTFKCGGTGAAGVRPSVPCQVLAVDGDHATVVVNDTQLNVEHFIGPLKAGSRAYLTEYYPLDMEGQKPKIFCSPIAVKNPEVLFIWVDCLDGGGNLVKRYRVSSYTGEYRVMDHA